MSELEPTSGPPSRERLILLANDSMRARRRPRAVATMWLFDVALGALVSAPAAAHVRSVWGAHPDGDAPLFRPGGVELLGYLADARHGFAVFASHATLVSLVGGIAALVPLALFLAAVAHTTADLRAPTARQLLPRAAAAFTPLLGLLVLAVVAQVVALALAYFSGVKLASWLGPRLGEPRADTVGVVAALALALGAAAIGVIHDLSRAAIVRFRRGVFASIRMGARTFARAPARLLWSWLWRAGAGVLPVLAVAGVATRLGGRPGFALVALFVLHQLVIAARVSLRASWLARAMRAVDAAYRS